MKVLFPDFALKRVAELDRYKGTSKNSEFAQMQGAEKFRRAAYVGYVSKKIFTQHSSWDEMWIFRGSHKNVS
jgi:hypothetical protein